MLRTVACRPALPVTPGLYAQVLLPHSLLPVCLQLAPQTQQLLLNSPTQVFPGQDAVLRQPKCLNQKPDCSPPPPSLPPSLPHPIKMAYLSQLASFPSSPGFFSSPVIFSHPLGSVPGQAVTISLVDYTLSLFCPLSVRAPNCSQEALLKAQS